MQFKLKYLYCNEGFAYHRLTTHHRSMGGSKRLQLAWEWLRLRLVIQCAHMHIERVYSPMHTESTSYSSQSIYHLPVIYVTYKILCSY